MYDSRAAKRRWKNRFYSIGVCCCGNRFNVYNKNKMKMFCSCRCRAIAVAVKKSKKCEAYGCERIVCRTNFANGKWKVYCDTHGKIHRKNWRKRHEERVSVKKQHQKRNANYYRINRDEILLKSKKRDKESRHKMLVWYIRKLLLVGTGLKREHVPKEMIEVKRLLLVAHRLIKQKRKEQYGS